MLVPDGWTVENLENTARVERGKFSNRPRNDPQFYGGEIPFIQTGDVSNSGGRIRTYKQTLNREGLRISKMFPKGTICITIAANIADVGILEFDSAFPDSIIGINPNEDIIDKTFLFYYLMLQKGLLNNFSVKSTQKNINMGYLNPLPIVIPPLKEQQKIAAILFNVDDLIFKTQELIDRLHVLKRGLMQKLLTEGIGHTEFKDTKAGKIPITWEIKRLTDVIKLSPNYKTPIQDDYIFVPMDAIDTDSMNILYFERRTKDKLTNVKFKNDDILFARITPSTEHGKGSLIKNLQDPIAFGSTELVVLSPEKELILPEFLFFTTKLPHFRSRAVQLMEGATGRQRVSKSFFQTQKILHPPKKEQEQIVKILINIDKKIENEKKYYIQLKEIKKGLMQILLTGKKRVQLD